MTKPSCAPFSGEMSGSTDVIIPIPMNENEAMPISASAAPKFALGMWMPMNAATTKNRIVARMSP